MGKLNFGKSACAVFLVCAATPIVLPAQTLKTLLSFDGADGAMASGTLVQATDGNLYGVTEEGGATGNGTVFKITPTGMLTTLYSFCSESFCTDGGQPQAGLVQGNNGNLYGTTDAGGAIGYGTIFKITPIGTLTTLYSFCSQSSCTDGEFPNGLIYATDGNFYGTTAYGGANTSCGGGYPGCGTVFKITPSGNLTTLYSFDYTDGYAPDAALIQATDGNFYGTTEAGGANGPCVFGDGCGTVFKITPTGTLTVLHSFDGTDGSSPEAALLQAMDGDFYGAAARGGANSGGTVFKITSTGVLTTLYAFCSQSNCADGQVPYGALVQPTNRNLYGTTDAGGAIGYGTVFKITTAGTLTTLYSFCSQSHCTDGEYPYAGLVQDTNGNFYGTTAFGGANSEGTAFSFSVGLGPFVETEPTSGRVGAAVKILGTNLTGATSVTFSGVAAVFKVVSSSEITTTVPTGATTGKVQVVTPHGTLSSNANFRVTP